VCHVAMAHSYWTGGLKFRFEFVCSAFNRGRVQIRYIPFYVTATPAGFGFPNANTCIVDLSDQTDLEVVVGWTQPQPYLNTVPTAIRGVSKSFMVMNPAGGGGGNLWADAINGWLFLEVLNPLTGPALSQTCYINVYLSGTGTTRFAVPTLDAVTDGTHSGASSLWQASGVGDADPPKPPALCFITGSDRTNPHLPQTFIGEEVRSVRALVKRYSYALGLFSGVTDTATAYTSAAYQWQVSNLLPYPGYTQGFSTGCTVPSWTFMGWFGLAYMGVRGGMRYKFYPTLVTNQPGYNIQDAFAHRSKLVPSQIDFAAFISRTLTVEEATKAGLFGVQSPNGIQFSKTSTGMVEVETGDFNVSLFRPTTSYAWVDVAFTTWLALGTDAVTFTLLTQGVEAQGASSNTGGPQVSVFMAGAEDLNFLWYLAAPLLH